MTTESWRPAAFRGFAWGALAGLALVALMYLSSLFLGLRPLPQTLSGPLLGLIVAMVAGLGVLGAAWAVTSRRWQFGQSALVFAAVGWLVVVVLLLPVSGDGFLGLNDGPTTPLNWGVLFAVYGSILQ